MEHHAKRMDRGKVLILENAFLVAIRLSMNIIFWLYPYNT
tara:strand:- start:344 stop:463 length:120 start_codon:yes stop_codon:yes gene_type:complete